ncbi:transcription factor [Fusarium langsethiae]|uniref:Transcription factor n=1 Tax=Fusarium langsethiae TaxID=179993 RepID=A0A0N0DCK0_FUSLA|nr:transcription factor [Fusarium langsethiae]
MSSVTQCQTCYCDFGCSDSLSAHIRHFDSEEWLLIEELALYRHHISKDEFGAWLRTQEPALRRYESYDVESNARLLSRDRTLHHKSKPREPHICQRCEQSFKTLKDLESHIGNYQLNEMRALGKLARCRLHIRTPDISYARDNDDQCPVESCDYESNDTSNLKRHFEKHFECFVVCPDKQCQRSFDSTSPFIQHLCTKERDVKQKQHVTRLKKAARHRVTKEYQRATSSFRAEARGKKNREFAPPPSDRPDKRRLLVRPPQAINEELSIARNPPASNFRPNNTEFFPASNYRTQTSYDNNLDGAFYLTNADIGLILPESGDLDGAFYLTNADVDLSGGLDGAYYLTNDFVDTNGDINLTNEYTNMNNQGGVELPQAHTRRSSVAD